MMPGPLTFNEAKVAAVNVSPRLKRMRLCVARFADSAVTKFELVDVAAPEGQPVKSEPEALMQIVFVPAKTLSGLPTVMVVLVVAVLVPSNAASVTV